MGIRRGQPKTSLFIRKTIAYKVIQYEKRYNLTSYKAWLKLTKHRAFKDLMLDHFKNKSGSAEWWTNNMKSPNVKKNFYKNHIKKFREELIKERLSSGIASLKNKVKKSRSR
jgi:hypothetical protein